MSEPSTKIQPVAQQQIPEALAVEIRRLAHDLSNALEIIVQTSYLLNMAELKEPASDWLRMMDTGVTKALDLNMQLREYIKLHTPRKFSLRCRDRRHDLVHGHTVRRGRGRVVVHHDREDDGAAAGGVEIARESARFAQRSRLREDMTLHRRIGKAVAQRAVFASVGQRRLPLPEPRLPATYARNVAVARGATRS